MACLWTLHLVFLLLQVIFHGADSRHLSHDLKEGLQDSTEEDQEVCPMWTRKHGNASSCTCGDSIGGFVLCDPSTLNVYILRCFCISYDWERNTSVFGACIYSCFTPQEEGSSGEDFLVRRTSLFHRIPHNESGADESCTRLNRRGLLCGDCMDGFAPSLFSHEIKCVNCAGPPTLYTYVKPFLIVLLHKQLSTF